jgi:two-component system, NarL family, response regulator YdfI
VKLSFLAAALVRHDAMRPADCQGLGACMSYTVLIVDDSALIRHSLRSCIEQNSNWLVCGEADNGKAAVEKVKELHPDVVILDFQMPVMNGLEAARQIANIAHDLPMIMFTMYKSEQLWQEAQAAGIEDLLSKSDASPKQLFAALGKCRSRLWQPAEK